MANEPRLLIPALGPVYGALSPLFEPLIRITIGLLLIPHGAQKLFGWYGGHGLAGTGQAFAEMGFEPGMFWATVVALLEFFGGILLILGLLTRPVALLVAIFMAVAVVVHLPQGFFWTAGGYEYPLMWGLVALAFVFRGGGRFSLDRALNREF